MKTLTLILVVATTGLAVASVQFYRQMGAERTRADAEVALRHKQDARIRELEQAQANLQEQLFEAQRPRMDLAPPPAVATARPAAGPPGVASRLERRDFAATTFGAVGRPMRGPMESEAGQRFMRTQMRGSIRRMYQDVGRELNLTQEQATKLMDLMADQQTRAFGERRQPPADRASAMQTYKEMQEQNNKEVAALIGESKMGEWKAYQESLPQRSQVDSVGQQLENAGVPMSAEQRSQLVAAMVEEAQANPRPTPVTGLAPEEAMKQMNDWQDAYDKSVSDRAKQVLNSEQYARYHDYTEWMTEMRKNASSFANGRAVRFSSGAAVSAYPFGPPVNSVVVAPAPPPRQ
jgi:hypothetical protein